MTTVRDELQYLTRMLNEKRTRLIEEVRELDRTLSLIDYLNTNNHQLRTHIQSTNRRQREGPQESHRYKRGHSPTFSEEDEEEGQIKKCI